MMTWLRRHFQKRLSGREGWANALVAIGLLGATSLASKALREWRTVVWAEETIWSRSLVKANVALDSWRSRNAGPSMQDGWLLIVFDDLGGRGSCERIARELGSHTVPAPVSILLVGSSITKSKSNPQPSRASTISGVPCAEGIRAPDANELGVSGAAPPNGSFILVDDASRAVYSSMRERDLSTVLTVRQLLLPAVPFAPPPPKRQLGLHDGGPPP